jgi:membrane protein YqaA with SNARE-associated domain
MATFGAYLGLFIVAFMAATVLPAQSELLLGALLIDKTFSPFLLIAVATVGNVIGSCVNWWIGRLAERFRERRWFPVSADTLTHYQLRYQRWGKWSLLLSWAPLIGDTLTLIAGVMREPFLPFVLIVTFAKLARYLVLAALLFRVL